MALSTPPGWRWSWGDDGGALYIFYSSQFIHHQQRSATQSASRLFDDIRSVVQFLCTIVLGCQRCQESTGGDIPPVPGFSTNVKSLLLMNMNFECRRKVRPGQESNLRPSAYRADALPTELSGQLCNAYPRGSCLSLVEQGPGRPCRVATPLGDIIYLVY